MSVAVTNDLILREAVKAALVKRHAGEANTIIVEELPTSRSCGRLDLAVLNGHLHGLEIKSDKDSLARLPRQEKLFSAAMQRMTLVVGQRHLLKATQIVPDWWRIVVATASSERSIQLKTFQRGRTNRTPNTTALAQLLERDELIAILNRHGADKGFRTETYTNLVRHVVKQISHRTLVREVLVELKFRAAWEAASAETRFGRTVVCTQGALIAIA